MLKPAFQPLSVRPARKYSSGLLEALERVTKPTVTL